jgi:hypothetical protein
MVRVHLEPSDNSTVIEAMAPAKLLLIPAQQDRPGSEVKRLKIIKVGDRKYRVFFLQDGRDASQWKEWLPNQSTN